MKNIVTQRQAIELSKKFSKNGKKIVLTGGCFDVIHPGHVLFLQKAKQHGDVLFVWIENDEKVAALKGTDRPIHDQNDRALVVANLKPVDYVIKLRFMKTDKSYDEFVKSLKPAIIATTKGDTNISHKYRQAEITGAEIIAVTKRLENHSSSRLAKLLSEQGL